MFGRGDDREGRWRPHIAVENHDRYDSADCSISTCCVPDNDSCVELMTTDSEFSSPNTNALEATDAGRTHRSRWLGRLLIAAIILLAAVAGLTYGIRRLTAPQPPVVSLDGLDPAIAGVLGQCYETVNRYPRTGAAWGWLGTALMAYDYKGEAQECFEHAEAMSATDPRWPYFHGLSMFPEDTAGGLEKLRRAVDLSQDDSSAARNRLAKILAEAGSLDEAELHFRRVQQRWPNDPDAVLGLGKVAFSRGEFQESLELVSQAATNRHTAKASRQVLAKIHYRLGNDEAARQAILEMQRLPEDVPAKDPFVDEAAMVWTGRKAWLEHTVRLYRQGRIEEALPLAERTVQIYPESPDAWAMLGRLKVRNEDLPNAQIAWGKTVDLAPESVEAHMELGIVLLQQGKLEDAKLEFDQTVKLNPSLSDGHHNLGLTLVSLNQPEAAVKSFQEAVRLKPDHFDSYLGLADAFIRAGNKDAARATLEDAIRVRPSDPRAEKLRERL